MSSEGGQGPAQVANEVTVANKDEGIADDFDGSPETRLNELVDKEPDLKDQNIDFDANNGVITITGTGEDRRRTRSRRRPRAQSAGRQRRRELAR
jgi:hypothetical protein